MSTHCLQHLTRPLAREIVRQNTPGPEPGLLASGLVPVLAVVRSIVDCRQVIVSKLSAAVQAMAQREEAGAEDASSEGGALFTYIIGKGNGVVRTCFHCVGGAPARAFA